MNAQSGKISSEWDHNQASSCILMVLAQLCRTLVNPLVPRMQKIKIRNLTLNRLLIVEFVKKMVYLEHQGLMGNPDLAKRPINGSNCTALPLRCNSTIKNYGKNVELPLI